MKYLRRGKLLFFGPLLGLILMMLMACRIPFNTAPAVVTVLVTEKSTETPQVTPQPSRTVSPTEKNTEVSSTPTQTATIGHSVTPGSPVKGIYINDSNSSVTAPKHYPQGGDYFNIDLFERPFSPQTQDTYFPQADILQTSFLNASPWVYASITLDGVNPQTKKLDATYALEMDLNLDGRGDFLLLVNSPDPAKWSTDGVQVWQDANQDVGGAKPINSDPPQKGDGYETLVFDQGKGADSDLAWAKVDPAHPNMLWFAFKPALINNSQKLMWGAWAQVDGLHPEWFDYNDHFTFDEAGSPIPGTAQYPLKGLAEVDNTCRWTIGFTPTGDEPGLCPLPPTPTAVPPTAIPTAVKIGITLIPIKPKIPLYVPTAIIIK